jgi:sn-glycerol 3-phosphate transport system substrate-binding protein
MSGPSNQQGIQMIRTLSFSALALAASLGAAQAQTEIQWWHAMGGELGTKLEEIVAGYNASQSDYKVVPTYKGSYTETMTAAIAAFRAGEQPAVVQVFEVGTGTMMAAEGAVYPVYQLMEDMGEDFDQSAFLPAVVGYYTDTDGNMLSMPFNSSTPILYYNKDVFEKAASTRTPRRRPGASWKTSRTRSWNRGAANCGFTTGWISWVQLENLSAWHNQPIGTLENGFGGLGTELTVNGPVQAKHWENLAKWQQDGLFQYAADRAAVRTARRSSMRRNARCT